ncbi:MAG: nitroreductase, partial [Bacteroidales bacterium]|nr:nitroreductase [Bacteroidales bacterium]
MTIKEAISARHMVRTYTDKPIPDDIITKLNERIALMNDAHGVQMKLITGENAPVWG